MNVSVLSIDQQFGAALAERGLAPPEIIADGKLHRFDGPEDRKGKKSAWYVLHSDGIAGGAAGDWKTGFQFTWSNKSEASFTAEDRAAWKRRMEQIRGQHDVERRQIQKRAAAKARSILKSARDATISNPYCLAKNVKPFGLKEFHDKNTLIVPIRNGAGQLVNLQFIFEDGKKRFLTGGEKSGCYYSFGGKPVDRILIVEGFATGASLHEATGIPVAVAFDKDNLRAVARIVRNNMPKCTLVLCADDDAQTAGNPGMTKATEAARAVGGLLAVPLFGDERPAGMSDFNDLHQMAGLEAVRQCVAAAAVPVRTEQISEDATMSVQELERSPITEESVWPDPLPIKSDLPKAPPFDALALLPKTMADYVLDEADRMPCPPDYIAAALVVCLGSVIGARCSVKPKRFDDWIVTPNLYGGGVGDPSVKKTPAFAKATRFLDRLEAVESEHMADREKTYAAEMAAFKAHESAIQGSMKKAASGKTDKLAMADAIRNMETLEEPEEPYPRRYKSNDATTEKLGDLLVKNTSGLLVFRDELIGLLASWEREGREGDKAFYLEAWNGTGSFAIDRIARGSLFVPNLCLSVFGGIQPDLLEKYLSSIAQSLDNDGRIQRFQVLVYPDATHWQWRDRYPVRGVRESVRDLFDRMASFDPVMDGAEPATDFVKVPYFSFDDGGQEIFILWATELHTAKIPGEQNPLMVQHLGKFEKLFCSLALILHLAEGRIGPIQRDSAIRAAAWCQYLEGHARRIYGLVEAAKVTAARTLCRKIADGKVIDLFTARDVARKCWSGLTAGQTVDHALNLLEEFGWIAAIDVQDGTGRPTTRYAINPKAKNFRSAP